MDHRSCDLHDLLYPRSFFYLKYVLTHYSFQGFKDFNLTVVIFFFYLLINIINSNLMISRRTFNYFTIFRHHRKILSFDLLFYSFGTFRANLLYILYTATLMKMSEYKYESTFFYRSSKMINPKLIIQFP